MLFEFKKTENGLYFIQAKRIGEAKISFELKDKVMEKVLSVLEVRVKIELVNHVEISGFPERKVELGSTFRLLALCQSIYFIFFIIFIIVKYNNMIISTSLCSIELYWTSRNPENILIENIGPEVFYLGKRVIS